MAGKGKAPEGFTPSTLGRNQDGNPSDFFAKTTGYGYNDMIALPTLTKDSILENLGRRFKVHRAVLLAHHAHAKAKGPFSVERHAPSPLHSPSLSVCRPASTK